LGRVRICRGGKVLVSEIVRRVEGFVE